MDDFRPRPQPDPSIASLSAETQGEVLSRQRFADLYRLADEEGLVSFARIGAFGQAEICLVFQGVDDFADAARDEATIDFHPYRDKLIAVVWTIADPRYPLGFPLRFAIGDERDRQTALRLLEQAAVPVHYLAWEQGLLTHVYTEQVNIPPDERDRALAEIRRLSRTSSGDELPAASGGDAAKEGHDVDVTSVSADLLSDEVLRETGVAYVLDYRRMEERIGPEQAQVQVMEAVLRALAAIRRDPRPQVQRGACTVWVARRDAFLHVYVTPGLAEWYPLVGESEADTHPFSRSFLPLVEFVGIREGSPLSAGAYPIVRFERGTIWHLELEDTVQQRLAALHDRSGETACNPYRS